MSNLYKKYIEGKCNYEERQQVLKKLGAKVPPVELLSFLKRYWYQLEDYKLEPSVDFEGILNRIHHTINLKESEDNKVSDSLLNRFFSLTRIAATVIVILMSSIGVWYAGKTGIFQKEVYYTVSSLRGQSSEVTLPDGSRVWLHGSSTIVYSSKYGIENRDLRLTGEGFFVVAKSKNLPFIVNVGDVKVKALGTSFNIDAYEDDRPIMVTLSTGRIIINRNEEEMELTPGMQAIIEKDKMVSQYVDTELYTSWHSGELVFKDERLINITYQLEKIYEVEFVFETPDLMNFRYRGSISLRNSILKTLEKLKFSTGIQYVISGNRIILKK
ncbi:FecR family protein [Thermophagus xiamenensis]|jgi:ferric-dicitrate binding protein FerR (iron transport regulator)|uniref:FecR family protein n=1 Tax=Thermophagus xiamenensis TaxID=385682 RepID=A0A1I2DT58_9BACT|nr:FecR family protein [Thermophagus xiamenensis]SFE83493.1 FecR family protein [Thermophagus xiamenensis]